MAEINWATNKQYSWRSSHDPYKYKARKGQHLWCSCYLEWTLALPKRFLLTVAPYICVQYSLRLFKHSEPHKTDSNPYTMEIARCELVWSYQFGEVRLYCRFFIHFIEGETRRAGFLCTSSGLFKHSEPHRTSFNYNIMERARCEECDEVCCAWTILN